MSRRVPGRPRRLPSRPVADLVPPLVARLVAPLVTGPVAALVMGLAPRFVGLRPRRLPGRMARLAAWATGLSGGLARGMPRRVAGRLPGRLPRGLRHRDRGSHRGRRRDQQGSRARPSHERHGTPRAWRGQAGLGTGSAQRPPDRPAATATRPAQPQRVASLRLLRQPSSRSAVRRYARSAGFDLMPRRSSRRRPA
jgi:hypothetical protein